MIRILSLTTILLAQSAGLAQDAPSYARQVRPFLAKYCVECHNPKTLKAGLDLETYKSLIEGSDRGPVVVAGKAEESSLVLLVEGKEKPYMPPKNAKFHPTKKEIGVLRAWVEAGAKDDSNLVKAVIPDIKPRHKLAAPCAVLAFRPDGKSLAAGAHRNVALLDPVNGGVIGRLSGATGRVTALAFSRDGKWLAAGAGQPGSAAELLLRQVSVSADGELIGKPTVIANAHADSILDIAFAPDSKLVATCSYDMRIKLWNVADGSEVRTLKEHSDSVYGVAFSRDGKLLASCAADRAVKVWDVATGKLLYTLGEANDWLYTVAFSPTTNHLACGGVDKSLRVYETGMESARLIHSVFAHEAAVQKIVYSADGKSLFSAGQDRVVKAWDAERMVERKTYDRQPEAILALAVHGNTLAVGRFDGAVVLLDQTTGKVLHEVTSLAQAEVQSPRVQPVSFVQKEETTLYGFPLVKEQEPNDSPGRGQPIKLPVTIDGKLDKAGEIDFYRFEAAEDSELGVHVVPGKDAKVDLVLRLYDQTGKILAEGNQFLGYKFAPHPTLPPQGGGQGGGRWYAVGVSDRELRGGKDMSYRLHLGDIPVVTSVFPLGLQRGGEGTVRVQGVHLGADNVRVKVSMDAAVGSKINLGLKTKRGMPLGKQEIVVGEFTDMFQASPILPVPGTAHGRLMKSGDSEAWTFRAKKGQRLIVEVDARRSGSPLDSTIEILDTQDQPLERALLRCQAKTFVTFRDHDSVGQGIRIDAWGELAANDLLYVGSELVKIRSLPTHPDADCIFFAEGGQRLGYLDTTPTHHSNGVSMYKVSVHPPGTTFPPNGFPVFPLHYRNDDGGPGYGRDSRIFFDPPADGEYRIRIRDARGQGSPGHVYRLTVRPPRPSFNVRFTPTNPSVPRGGSLPLTITADRLDGYEGPIHIDFSGLPEGYNLPSTTILPDDTTTAVALYAAAAAKAPMKSPLKMTAHAVIDGQKAVKEVTGETPALVEPGDIVTFTDESEVVLKPGGQAKLTVVIDRRNKFAGRVPLEVRGLPHGVRVLDIGLNGILITERESRRTMVFYAEPWVQPMSHPIAVSAKREGTNVEHGAKSVLLKVAK